jgi:hypothetical protein
MTSRPPVSRRLQLSTGHNIVAGTVPVGTLLYHGRKDSELPSVPEWTATDPEHSNMFCGQLAPPPRIYRTWTVLGAGI